MPHSRAFCSGEMSGFPGTSGFELYWGPLVPGPGVTQRWDSFFASVRAREQFCFYIDFTWLTHLRN